MIEVTHEVQGGMPDRIWNAVEGCVFCFKSTRHWWRDGIMPVCPECAKYQSEEETLEYARDRGYGPL